MKLFPPRPYRHIAAPPAHLEPLESRTLLGASPFPDLALLENPSDPVARIHTPYGDIDLELLAAEVPLTVANFIGDLDSLFGFHQTFFNRVDPGHVLEGGTYSWLGDRDEALHASQYSGAPGETGRANLARTVSTWARHTPGPPFAQFVGSGYSINLQDNTPPAANGDWVVFAKVLGDASWSVVQTIAGLSAVDFMNTAPMQTPYASDLASVPVTRPWSPGDPVTPDLLVQAWDTSLIRAPGATDYYRNTIYSAEGFTGSTINEYIPIENPSDTTIFYEARARYENVGTLLNLNIRDDLIERGSIAPHSRGGITVSTIENWGNATVADGKPYAIEVRSTLPVAAQLSHYDFGSATGEGFTSHLDTRWFLFDIQRGNPSHDFLLFDNPGDQPAQLDIAFHPPDGGVSFQTTLTIDRYRRAGLDMESLPSFIGGLAVVTSTVPILATHTHYGSGPGKPDPQNPNNDHRGYSTVGASGDPSLSGVVPIALEPGGDLFTPLHGIRLSLYNPSNPDATVEISLYSPTDPNSVITESIIVSHGWFAYNSPGFQIAGNASAPLALVFHSNVPIYTAALDDRREDLYSSTVATSAATDYHFAEGFLDPARLAPGILEEEFSVFNPNSSIFNAPDRDAHITFTFRFTDGGTLAINQTVQHGTLFRLVAADTQQLLDHITSNHVFFFSVEVTSDIPIVAQMLHCDATLGDPNRAAGGFITDGTIFGPITRLDHLGGYERPALCNRLHSPRCEYTQ